MNRSLARVSTRGFTLLELLVVLAVIIILLATVLPVDTYSSRTKARMISCESNLRQIGVAACVYSRDHQDKSPSEGWRVEKDDVTGRSDPTNFFLKILAAVPSPRCFWCPLDLGRVAAASPAGLTRSNLSYFVNVDANQTNRASDSVLAGDRCLSVNSKPVSAGVLLVTPGKTVTWTPTAHASGGNFVFADGFTEQAEPNINQVLHSQPSPENHLVLP